MVKSLKWLKTASTSSYSRELVYASKVGSHETMEYSLSLGEPPLEGGEDVVAA